METIRWLTQRLVRILEYVVFTESKGLGSFNIRLVGVSAVFLLLLMLMTSVALDPAPRYEPSVLNLIPIAIIQLGAIVICAMIVIIGMALGYPVFGPGGDASGPSTPDGRDATE